MSGSHQGAGRIGRVASALRATPHVLAVVYLVASLVSVCVMTLAMPPFQHPDEPAHFMRAEQVSRLGFVARRFASGQAGGVSDVGIYQAAAAFQGISFHPEVKARLAAFETAGRVGWGGGTVDANFSNTALYPPWFYLPAASGVGLGRHFHFSVVQTLYISRALTGAAASLVGAAAVVLAQSAAPWLFAVLCLPMTMSLFTSVSQDALLIATSALAAGLVASGGAFREAMPTWRFGLLCVALAAVCAARPPYLPFALLIGIVKWRGGRERALAFGLVVAVAFGWAAIALQLGGVVAGSHDPAIQPMAQLMRLFHHPWVFVQVLGRTFDVSGGNLCAEIVGRFGWLDTALPRPMHHLAWLVLGLSGMCGMAGGGWRSPDALARAACVVCVLAGSTVLLELIEYATWTPLGGQVVNGVQGRYFLPILLVAACIVRATPPPFPAWKAGVGLAIAAFPMISIAVTTRTLIVRYYLG